MFNVSVETRFWAPHRLTLPDGSKEPVHQHNWVVTAEVGSEELNSMGVVIDFHELKAMIDNIVADFDNRPLEQHDYFQRNNPSAENVAKYIYEELTPELPEDVKLRQVTVIEQPGCAANFGGQELML